MKDKWKKLLKSLAILIICGILFTIYYKVKYK